MPAMRKVCDFQSHSAELGCHQCYREFSKCSLCHLYSNFQQSSWYFGTIHVYSKHRNDVHHLLQCSRKLALSWMESELGCRYSFLLEHPYFNPIQMTIIDPMHNLFLGSVKHITILVRAYSLNQALVLFTNVLKTFQYKQIWVTCLQYSIQVQHLLSIQLNSG